MGYGFNGNIGNGSILDVNTPTQVGIDNDWNIITTSYNSCGIKNDGTLWSWGGNFQGQVGNCNFINQTTPIQVGIDKTWLNVKTGANHTLAISNENTLYAWGFNNKGQLGDGTLQTRNTITQIGNSCPLSSSSFETLQGVQAIPNPANNVTMIHFFANENTEVEFTITNNLGQIVYKKSKICILGKNQESIDLSALSVRLYCVSVKTNSKVPLKSSKIKNTLASANSQ